MEVPVIFTNFTSAWTQGEDLLYQNESLDLTEEEENQIILDNVNDTFKKLYNGVKD